MEGIPLICSFAIDIIQTNNDVPSPLDLYHIFKFPSLSIFNYTSISIAYLILFLIPQLVVLFWFYVFGPLGIGDLDKILGRELT